MVNRPDPAPGPGKNQNARRGPSRRRRIVEDVFLVLAIFPLWPKILGWPGLLWDVILFADLVLLAQNPLDPNIPDEDLSEIKVVATIIGGELAYGSLE